MPCLCDMFVVSKKFLLQHKEHRDVLYEVEAPGGWAQRRNIWLNIQLGRYTHSKHLLKTFDIVFFAYKFDILKLKNKNKYSTWVQIQYCKTFVFTATSSTTSEQTVKNERDGIFKEVRVFLNPPLLILKTS